MNSFLLKLIKWIVVVICIFVSIWLITFFTNNIMIRKIDVCLEQDRNLSNIQISYSHQLNNYVSVLNIYRFFHPSSSSLLVYQSYLLALRNYPNHSQFWDKDIERIKVNLAQIIDFHNTPLSISDYSKLALAAQVVRDTSRSRLFTDLAIANSSSTSIREIAFFSYWYLKDYVNAKKYYETYFQEIGGYDKDPSAFVEYLDVLLSVYPLFQDQLKQSCNSITLLDQAYEPMLAFLKQRVSLKLYELCSVKPEIFNGSDCHLYYDKAQNEFAVSKYTPENITSPDLIVSQIKVRLFQLGVPDSFLYFNVNKDNIETYIKVFQDSFQELRETEILYSRENIFNNHFYLFLLGYLAEFNNDLLGAKTFYEQYLAILQNQSILDPQEQTMISTAFYRLARVNILIDEYSYISQIVDNKEKQELFTSWDTVKTSLVNIVYQENIFLNQEIANKLLKYQYEENY